MHCPDTSPSIFYTSFRDNFIGCWNYLQLLSWLNLTYLQGATIQPSNKPDWRLQAGLTTPALVSGPLLSMQIGQQSLHLQHPMEKMEATHA